MSHKSMPQSMITESVKTYGCDASGGSSDNGCVERSVSKSPYAYLRHKFIRDGGEQVVGLVNSFDYRYGTRSTPTTRRTSYDRPDRRYY